MLTEPLCPICSAEPFQCDHEILRWSSYGGDYEESPLMPLAKALERAVAGRLEVAWQRREAPTHPVLREAYEIGLNYLGEDWESSDRLSESGGQLEYVMETLRTLPGVVTLEDETTCQFYAADPDRVKAQLDDQIRALEVETAKEPEK